MGKLISLTTFVVDSTTLSPSSIYAIQADNIVSAVLATTNQKHAYPAASQGINTAVHTNNLYQNEGASHVLLVNESVSTIISGS